MKVGGPHNFLCVLSGPIVKVGVFIILMPVL